MHRWSIQTFQPQFKQCWMRQLQIDVIVSTSVVARVIASQNCTTPCYLRARQIPTVFLACRSSFANWWSHLLGMASDCPRSSCVKSELRRKIAVENCYLLRVSRAVLRQENTICWNITSLVANSHFRRSFQRVHGPPVSEKSRARLETK